MGDTSFIQMIEMIMTDKEIINLCKNVGIRRKLTLPFYKGNISEYGIEHDSFTCQLEEERVMPQPYQRISHYGIQRTKIADLRIPLHSLLFFTLRVRRQTPFQDTAHTRTEAVLSVKKAPAHHRIASPIRIDSS